jgi:hypothetical protein
MDRDGMGSVHVTHNEDTWQAVVIAVMNFGIPYNRRELLE